MTQQYLLIDEDGCLGVTDELLEGDLKAIEDGLLQAVRIGGRKVEWINASGEVYGTVPDVQKTSYMDGDDREVRYSDIPGSYI